MYSMVSSQFDSLCSFHYLKEVQGQCYFTEIQDLKFIAKNETKLKVLQSDHSLTIIITNLEVKN